MKYYRKQLFKSLVNHISAVSETNSRTKNKKKQGGTRSERFLKHIAYGVGNKHPKS